VPYDFGFCWNGRQRADWQCDRGDGRPSSSCAGTLRWSRDEDENDEAVRGELGDDFEVTYTSTPPSQAKSGQTLLIGTAATFDPLCRDDWVGVAQALHAVLTDAGLL